MANIVSLDGIIINYYDYDECPGDPRVGSLLMICDVDNGVTARVTSQQYSKKTLSELYSCLEKLHKEKKLKMETMIPLFKEYGLKT